MLDNGNMPYGPKKWLLEKHKTYGDAQTGDNATEFE